MIKSHVHLVQILYRMKAWIQNGWLIPYPESQLGPPKGLIPLMAILQESKQKVRPVMDYRELNEHVNAYTANALRTKFVPSAVTVRICIIVRSRKNLHTCKLPLAGSRSPLVKYARGSHIGFRSTNQTRSCALRMPRYVTFTVNQLV